MVWVSLGVSLLALLLSGISIFLTQQNRRGDYLLQAKRERAELQELLKSLAYRPDRLKIGWAFVFATNGTLDASMFTDKKLSVRDLRSQIENLLREFTEVPSIEGSGARARAEAAISVLAKLRAKADAVSRIIDAEEAAIRANRGAYPTRH